ncbi:MAG: DNA-3-methyladenine glycosylase [Patescibacteria group bacterium]|nr:DNA-3-methyladenine glycosylase [Patescibacteria group bacterium]
MSKLKRDFYARDTLTVAKELLGKFLIHDYRGKKYIGKIVETEAYIGEEDKACHGRFGRTKRNEILFGEPGYAYVYMIYGMYYLLNIITEEKDFPAGILIRAVEPVTPTEAKRSLDFAEAPLEMTKERIKELRKLGSGPGVLTRWMEITGIQNGVDLVESNELYITNKLSKDVILATGRRPESKDSSQAGMTGKKFEVVKTTRVGVEYAGKWAYKPWRFYIKDNPFVSKK